MATKSFCTEHTFTFDDGASKTRYLAAGPEDGPLLIFVHGWIAVAETWLPQLQTFSNLGFRALAPDLRGYGGSTSTPNPLDYRLERHALDLVALLAHLDAPKAVLVGHDWGAPVVWAFAAHYPEKCAAAAVLTVPYRTVECGMEHTLTMADRELYPEAEYPWAQWEYMAFHNENPDEMVQQLESDPEAFLKVLYLPGTPGQEAQPTFTAFVRKQGGFAPKGFPALPLEATLLNNHPEMLEALVKTVRSPGTAGPNAYYRNFAANAAYTAQSANGGVLEMPVLFIGAAYDYILDAVINPRLKGPMREFCRDLTEVDIKAGHWVALEKSGETNAAIARWLVESVEGYWPGEALEKVSKKAKM